MCKSVTAVALLWCGIYYDLHIENREEIKMTLNEAIEVSRKCLYGSPHYLERQGITEKVKDDAYTLLSEYHGKIALLYKNNGATESVLSALCGVGND